MRRQLLGWALLGAVALLALQARTAHGDDNGGAGSWRPATNNALEFEIFAGTLGNFDGGTLSIRRQHGEHAVWRFGCTVSAFHRRYRESVREPGFGSITHPYGGDEVLISAQVTRLTLPWPERRLRPWAGLALGGDWSRIGKEGPSQDLSVSITRRVPEAYTAALAGLEYSVTPRFVMHAQYGQGVEYARRDERGTLVYGVRESLNLDRHDWQLYSTGARFGIAVFY